MDPNFYTALMTQWADPGKMMRWAMMPMDPKVWGMMMQGLNPNMYLKWMMAPIDPKLWSLMMQPMNPNLYTGWLGQSLNPQTYGAWGSWMNPSTYTVPGMGGMGGPTSTAPTVFNPFEFLAPGYGQYGQPGAAPVAGSAPAGTFNFFDPNTWTQMWNPTAWTNPAAPSRLPPSKQHKAGKGCTRARPNGRAFFVAYAWKEINQARRQFVPCGPSSRMMPAAFNSSRMRSASAKFLDFLAAARASILRSMLSLP